MQLVGVLCLNVKCEVRALGLLDCARIRNPNMKEEGGGN